MSNIKTAIELLDQASTESNGPNCYGLIVDALALLRQSEPVGIAPSDVETHRFGGTGSGVLSPSSKGECSGASEPAGDVGELKTCWCYDENGQQFYYVEVEWAKKAAAKLAELEKERSAWIKQKCGNGFNGAGMTCDNRKADIGHYVTHYKEAKEIIGQLCKAAGASCPQYALQNIKQLNAKVAALEKANERLAKRDCNATVQLVYDDGGNPFAREELKKVDIGVADNCYVVESETVKRLQAENERLKKELAKALDELREDDDPRNYVEEAGGAER